MSPLHGRLAAALERRSADTVHHQRRIAQLAGLLAAEMGWDDEERRALELAASTHDIGKVAMPRRLLAKPGTLGPLERKIIQTHTIFGALLLQAKTAAWALASPAPPEPPGGANAWAPASPAPPEPPGDANAWAPASPAPPEPPGDANAWVRLARSIALHHHERWDGRGYPRGLAGKAIPLGARIVAVADVFDALTHSRVYRPAFPEGRAIAFMRTQRGRHFDPEVMDCFLDLLPQIAPSEDSAVAV